MSNYWWKVESSKNSKIQGHFKRFLSSDWGDLFGILRLEFRVPTINYSKENDIPNLGAVPPWRTLKSSFWFVWSLQYILFDNIFRQKGDLPPLTSPIFDPFNPPILYMGQRWWLPVSYKWNCPLQYLLYKRINQTQIGQIIQPQFM